MTVHHDAHMRAYNYDRRARALEPEPGPGHEFKELDR